MILQKDLKGNSIMSKLPTRLRRNPILRDLVQETQLSINDLVSIFIKKLLLNYYYVRFNY